MGTDSTHLELDLEQDTPQIQGSLSAAGQQPVSFTGWLQLISLIEQMSGHEPVRPTEGTTT
jgi:hypothetical protein